MRSGVPGGPGKLAEVSRRRAVAALGTLVLALAGAAVLPGPRTAAAAARPTRPALVFSPSRYDYGQVSPGQSSLADVHLEQLRPEGHRQAAGAMSGPAAFSITGSTCRATRLRPGGACAITVRFAPSRPGRITATLTAASKGGSQHATTASGALTGAGRALGAAPGQIIWVSTDEIWTANLDGTSPHAIVTGQVDPEGITANSSHLYWADGAAGTIWEANLDGSSPHIIVTSQRGQPGLAVTRQPYLLGQRRWRRGPGRHDLGRQPGWQQSARHRHRTDSPGRGGGRRQPRLLGRRRKRNSRERHDQRGQPRWDQPAHHRHRPDGAGRGGRRRQSPVLGQPRQRHGRERPDRARPTWTGPARTLSSPARTTRPG